MKTTLNKRKISSYKNTCNKSWAIQKSNELKVTSHEFIFQIWRRYHKKIYIFETIYIYIVPPPPHFEEKYLYQILNVLKSSTNY